MRALAAILSGLALLISIVATTYLMNAPLYRGIETHCTESGCETIQTTKTLVEANGAWVINQLVLVTVVSGIPFIVALRRSNSQRLVTWVTALLLLAYSIAGSFTIGLAFMPGALLLLIAGLLTLFIHN